MTSLEAFVAYQTGSYKNFTHTRLVEAIDALNVKIDGLEQMFRSKEIEPTLSLRADLRMYQEAKDAMVLQSGRTETINTF